MLPPTATHHQGLKRAQWARVLCAAEGDPTEPERRAKAIAGSRTVLGTVSTVGGGSLRLRVQTVVFEAAGPALDHTWPLTA